MSQARAAAIITWLYAAGFGLSAIPVAIYLNARDTLPSFFDMFEMYAGPWSSWVDNSTLIVLMLAFLVVLIVAAWSAWLLWRGSKAGAVLNLALLPIEAIFWFGFALPIPWVMGIARVALVVTTWKSLGEAAPASQAP